MPKTFDEVITQLQDSGTNSAYNCPSAAEVLFNYAVHYSPSPEYGANFWNYGPTSIPFTSTTKARRLDDVDQSSFLIADSMGQDDNPVGALQIYTAFPIQTSSSWRFIFDSNGDGVNDTSGGIGLYNRIAAERHSGASNFLFTDG